MKRYNKKCGIIFGENDKPMFVVDLVDFESEEEYLAYKKLAKENFDNYVKIKKREDKLFKQDIEKSVKDLAIAVKHYTKEK